MNNLYHELNKETERFPKNIYNEYIPILEFYINNKYKTFTNINNTPLIINETIFKYYKIHKLNELLNKLNIIIFKSLYLADLINKFPKLNKKYYKPFTKIWYDKISENINNKDDFTHLNIYLDCYLYNEVEFIGNENFNHSIHINKEKMLKIIQYIDKLTIDEIKSNLLILKNNHDLYEVDSFGAIFEKSLNIGFRINNINYSIIGIEYYSTS